MSSTSSKGQPWRDAFVTRSSGRRASASPRNSPVESPTTRTDIGGGTTVVAAVAAADDDGAVEATALDAVLGDRGVSIAVSGSGGSPAVGGLTSAPWRPQPTSTS